METDNIAQRYKYNLNPDIPWTNRDYYKIMVPDFLTLADLQTKYKLKYVFDDNSWTIMNIGTHMYWIQGTVKHDITPTLSFEEFYRKINHKIKSVMIYKEEKDFKDYPIDMLMQSNQIIHIVNPDYSSYKLEYDIVVRVLLKHMLIGGVAGGYYGIHDNKTLKWVYGYTRNHELKKLSLSLDAILYGLYDDFMDLRDYLMELYIRYKDAELIAKQSSNITITCSNYYIMEIPFGNTLWMVSSDDMGLPIIDMDKTMTEPSVD